MKADVKEISIRFGHGFFDGAEDKALSRFVNEIIGAKIRALREKVKNKSGAVLPPVNINDDALLKPCEIEVTIDGICAHKNEYDANYMEEGLEKFAGNESPECVRVIADLFAG